MRNFRRDPHSAAGTLGNWCFLLILLIMVPQASSADATTCDLLVFVPFSYNLEEGTNFRENFKRNNLGFSHLAAAALAVEHFNQRNAAVVPDLDITLNRCPDFTLSFRGVYDTGITSHDANTFLFEDIMSREGVLPCAIVGGYFDLPSQVLGTTAAAIQTPLTTYRSYNLRSADPYFTPFTNTMYPDQLAMAQVLVNFLRFKERTNFISLLYKLGDTPVQLEQVVALTLEEAGMEFRQYKYQLEDDLADLFTDHTRSKSLDSAIQELKTDGYRTIVCIMEFPELEVDQVARAAERAGINTADYFWLFVGTDLSTFSLPPVELELVHLRLLAGSAIVTPLEGFQADPVYDPFFQAWNKTTNTSFIQHVNALPPLWRPNNISDRWSDVTPELIPGYYQASETYFQDFDPASGAGFMYDAIMATGLGACNVLAAGNPLTGVNHLAGIRGVSFTGATGDVSLEDPNHGRRNASQARYGVVNLFDQFALVSEDSWAEMLTNIEQKLQLYAITDTVDFRAGDGIKSLVTAAWKQYHPFIFRSGLTTPPKLLRTEPDQNYLSRTSHIIGLFLMSLAMFACVVSAVWLLVNRNERIVRSSQPYFMCLICFGAFVESLAILPISFDESYGWSPEALDAACASVPWFVAMGHLHIYGSLFSKLWRINRVLQFQRRVVKMKHVAWPMALLFLVAVALLITMTIVAPLEYERVVIDPLTGASIGRCNSDKFTAFILPLSMVMLIPTIMTGFMAWKTNDVDAEYSESYWIFILIIVQIEVIVLGIPVIDFLRDLDTTGRYWGVVVIIWTFPASTIALLMVPKVLAHYRQKTSTQKRGGGSGAVRVSGAIEDVPSSHRVSSGVSELRSSAGTSNIDCHNSSTVTPP